MGGETHIAPRSIAYASSSSVCSLTSKNKRDQRAKRKLENKGK